MWRLTLLRRSEVPRLLDDALGGDQDAGRLYTALKHTLGRVAPERCLCLFCDYEFSADNMPATLLFLFAAHEDAETAISNGLCPACATLDNLPIRVIDKYRDAMIPISASSPNRVRLATPDFYRVGYWYKSGRLCSCESCGAEVLGVGMAETLMFLAESAEPRNHPPLSTREGV